MWMCVCLCVSVCVCVCLCLSVCLSRGARQHALQKVREARVALLQHRCLNELNLKLEFDGDQHLINAASLPYSARAAIEGFISAEEVQTQTQTQTQTHTHRYRHRHTQIDSL